MGTRGTRRCLEKPLSQGSKTSRLEKKSQKTTFSSTPILRFNGLHKASEHNMNPRQREVREKEEVRRKRDTADGNAPSEECKLAKTQKRPTISGCALERTLTGTMKKEKGKNRSAML